MNDEIAEQPYVLRPSVKKPLMVRLVLATGLVSTETQANYVLLALALAGFLLSGILLFSSGHTTQGLSNQDIERITQLQEQSASYAQ